MFLQRQAALYFYALFFGITLHLSGSEISINPKPVALIKNPCSNYTLINSVDYHPKINLFCMTCTHENKIIFYKNDKWGKAKIVQTLSNPFAKLSLPQHAVFSSDGKTLIVANWGNETFTFYSAKKNNSFFVNPAEIISSPSCLEGYKPHGIAISPCGNFLGVAYGAANYHGRALALFNIRSFVLLSTLKNLPGIPKGITFSPDGSCLLVTFSDVNSLVIFDLLDKTILETPRQIIQGPETGISRPEDVKICRDGNYCAITNSNRNTVTFYPFDKTLNSITQSIPSYILQNPESQLCFPHGIAFSPDGAFLLISSFGRVNTTTDGDISWDDDTSSEESYVSIYMINP